MVTHATRDRFEAILVCKGGTNVVVIVLPAGDGLRADRRLQSGVLGGPARLLLP